MSWLYIAVWFAVPIVASVVTDWFDMTGKCETDSPDTDK